MNPGKIFYEKQKGQDNLDLLKIKVALYFKEKQISPKANVAMVIKSLFLFGLLIAAYLLLLINPWQGWVSLPLYSLLGIVVAFATMNISHDALHGAYLSSAIGNRALGYLMDICGKSSFHWGSEHVIDHHNYTNIGGYDQDLNVDNPFLRLCPNTPHIFYHRYQHLYAPLLYCIYPLYGVFDEYLKSYRIIKNMQSKKKKFTPAEIFFFFFLKAIHFILFMIVPKIVVPLTWTQISLGYICYAAGVGVTLAFVFQLAHIVENVSFPNPKLEGKMGHSFLDHQLKTTANFATRSKLLHFLFGGLSFQVEHHLFPHVCHIHLFDLAPMIRDSELQCGLPYNENRTFLGAIKSHFRTLKALGSPNKLS
jgi:linoleoyl-CoA desaturase